MSQHRKSKKHSAYKEANEAFLQVKAQEEGMHVLDNGVIYRVLEEGRGTRSPKPSGIVYVHYTGRLIRYQESLLKAGKSAYSQLPEIACLYSREVGIWRHGPRRHPGAQYADLRT